MIPSPFEVTKELVSGHSESGIYGYLLITIWTAFKCLLAGCLAGYVGGLILSRLKRVQEIAYPLLNGIRSVPITSFIPIFLMVFGLYHFVIPMVSIPIFSMIAVNTSKAVSSCDSNRKILLETYNIPYSSYLINIVFWETLEVLIATLRIAVPYALALVIAIEYFVGINNGIGQFIYDSYYFRNYVDMYSGILVSSLFGVLLVYLIDIISNRLLVWKRLA